MLALSDYVISENRANFSSWGKNTLEKKLKIFLPVIF
jgi:hypothetical protein